MWKPLVRFASALALTLTLGAGAQAAPIIYQNGLLDGTKIADGIGIANSVSDSLIVSASDVATSVTFGAWTSTGATLSSVNWILSTEVLGAGTVLGSGTATTLSQVFQFTSSPSYDVSLVSFALPNIALDPGTYFLTLHDSTATSGGALWDVATGATTSTSAKVGVSPIASHFFFIAGSTDAPELDGSTAALPLTFSLLALLSLRRRRLAL